MTPDWHDYPTGPGLWRMRAKYFSGRRVDVVVTCYECDGELVCFSDHTIRSEPPERTNEYRKIRYYGPLPHDPQDQGETN